MFWDRPLFHRNSQKNNIDIPMFRFFLERSLHACVAMCVSIQTNFKPDLISFPVHITPLSRLSQWSIILSQQVHLCPE